MSIKRYDQILLVNQENEDVTFPCIYACFSPNRRILFVGKHNAVNLVDFYDLCTNSDQARFGIGDRFKKVILRL